MLLYYYLEYYILKTGLLQRSVCASRPNSEREKLATPTSLCHYCCNNNNNKTNNNNNNMNVSESAAVKVQNVCRGK
jgi:hypothetical protein